MSKTKKLLIILALLLLSTVFLYWQNNSVVVTKFEFASTQLPKSFDGFKILQISDLHNKTFGNEQSTLASTINELEPDIIVITGDIIDKNRTNIAPITALLHALDKRYPIYYVSGNHEKISGHYDELKNVLLEYNVTILDTDIAQIDLNGEFINVIGLQDVGFYASEYDGNSYEVALNQHIQKLVEQTRGNFYFALSHRPEFIKYYSDNQIPLIFTGHAHGGQIRLPFIGGLIAPGQGILPKYTSGAYTQDNTTMVVSRGLGNSIFPFRVFNRPELIQATLKSS